MKSFSYVLMSLGILAWCVAFFFGPNTQFWVLGKPGVIAAGAGFFFYLLCFLSPKTRPGKAKSSKGPTRKCRICGRPALPDSDLCRYHTDEQKVLKGDEGYY
ncbi:hypothetical protein GF402_10870 [Candidatus Fermentibacteria bacterium]|nr:hypothetical protein [Candidatus Fermentibacteria bacterium]